MEAPLGVIAAPTWVEVASFPSSKKYQRALANPRAATAMEISEISAMFWISLTVFSYSEVPTKRLSNSSAREEAMVPWTTAERVAATLTPVDPRRRLSRDPAPRPPVVLRFQWAFRFGFNIHGAGFWARGFFDFLGNGFVSRWLWSRLGIGFSVSVASRLPELPSMGCLVRQWPMAPWVRLQVHSLNPLRGWFGVSGWRSRFRARVRAAAEGGAAINSTRWFADALFVLLGILEFGTAFTFGNETLGWNPSFTKNFLTMLARRKESFWLRAALPRISVWPTMVICPSSG